MRIEYIGVLYQIDHMIDKELYNYNKEHMKKIFLILGVVLIIGALGWQWRSFQTAQMSQPSTKTETNTVAEANTTAPENPSAQAPSTTFTTSQVAEHSIEQSCWIIVNGSVCDVTAFIDKHPGGSANILKECGKDATSDFMGQHGGNPRAEGELATLKIGTLQ